MEVRGPQRNYDIELGFKWIVVFSIYTTQVNSAFGMHLLAIVIIITFISEHQVVCRTLKIDHFSVTFTD